MKMKKVVALILAVVLCLGCLAGCAGEEETPAATTETPAQTENNDTAQDSSQEAEAEKELVTLKVFTAASDGWDPDDCEMTRFLEEKFNVDLQFEAFSTTDTWATQLNLLLASGEYPDLFLGGNLTTAQIVSAVEAGAFLPLNDYIVEGTTYYTMLEENPNWKNMVTANDGNIYSFVYSDSSTHTACEYKMHYRVDWMEKLGWETPPSTPEEFKEYLIQVRDTDVNGNGDPNDEIPLMGHYNGRKTDPICYLMNPFELYTDSYHYITDDGEIYFSAITDGWREGLAYIADLYAEGLIAEETYVQDGATFKSILNKPEGEEVVGMCPHWYIQGQFDREVTPWLSFEALAPLKGEYQQAAYGPRFYLNSAISTQCENPDRAFELLDYLLSNEGDLLQKYGFEGKTYEWVDEVNFLGTTPSVKQTWDKEEYLKWIWPIGRAPVWDIRENRYGVEQNKEENTYVLVEAHKQYEPYYVDHNIPYTVWAPDDVIAEYTELKTLIDEYILVSDTEFIMGIKDIHNDAQWQEYLDQLNDMGLERYIEVLYSYYGLK